MKSFLVVLVFAIFMNNHLHAKPLSSLRIRRNAVKDKSQLWPNATVVYAIDSSITATQRVVIQKAMNDISSVSCIRFKERTYEWNYVYIRKGYGVCSADVGYQGGFQKITLGEYCYNMRTLYHELFHTIGFQHEHVRPDRDQFVIVHKNNIQPVKFHNFEKEPYSKVTTLGLRYDFRSILHYHDKSFAIDRKMKTLEPVTRDRDIDLSVELSLLDIMKLNLLYNCFQKQM